MFTCGPKPNGSNVKNKKVKLNELRFKCEHFVTFSRKSIFDFNQSKVT